MPVKETSDLSQEEFKELSFVELLEKEFHEDKDLEERCRTKSGCLNAFQIHVEARKRLMRYELEREILNNIEKDLNQQNNK